MTVRKLFKKYQKIQKDGFEMIIVHQVVNDLYQIIREQDLRNYKRKHGNKFDI